MKVFYLLFLTLIICPKQICAQEKGVDLYKLLHEADSVQIASHEDLAWMEKVPPYRTGSHQLVHDGKINDTIIKERIT